MIELIIRVIQCVIALGLLNVWVLRSHKATAYRGGNARTLREEFAVYGLPGWFCSVVGALKIGVAFALILGLWYPIFVVPASALLVFLMLGAVVMHAKVADPITKAIPAALMLLMGLMVLFCSYRSS